MSVENIPVSGKSQTSPATSNGQPNMTGGLYLSGCVVAVKIEDKEWEGKKYRQSVTSISDGEQVFLWKERADDPGFKPMKMFQHLRLRVNRATTEKGQISVAGMLVE